MGEPVPNQSKDASRLYKDINPLVQIEGNDKKPLAVHNKNEAGRSMGTIPSGVSNDDIVSIKSSYFWKVVPKNKIRRKMSLSTFSSTSLGSNLHQNNKYDISLNCSIQSASTDSSVIELPVPPIASPSHSVHQLSSSSRISLNDNDDYNFSYDSDSQTVRVTHPIENEEIQDMTNTPSIQLQHPVEQEEIHDFATITPQTPDHQAIESSRPRSARSIKTRISLTSGKSLVLQLNPSSESVVKDVTK